MNKKAVVSAASNKVPNCVMVIFGAAGDLTKRLLLPSICHLGAQKLLPKNFALIGFAHDEHDTESFRELMQKNLITFVKDKASFEFGQSLIKNMYYQAGDFNCQSDYGKLDKLIKSVEKKHATNGNRLFYLATPPRFFANIISNLGVAKLSQEEENRWRRVIIEKPFGRDLDSAKQLNNQIREVLKERQIFRIDHYLGKETVQNIMAFRFSNGIFEPIWNRQYIDNIQITVTEDLGVELRGSYYDKAGALRDMVPNHIMQLISLIAMEPPSSFEASYVRDEKAKVLKTIVPIKQEDVFTCAVRGQYDEGFINNKNVISYVDEVDVVKNSTTETFVALKLVMENWRWGGVPIYLRTGKRLANRCTQIAIQFKTAPSIMFRKTQVASLSPNLLVIRIYPEEGISLRFGAKKPGPILEIGNVDMNFCYQDYFGGTIGTGYETLLYDCMMGDGTLFQRADMVEDGWSIVQPIIDVWTALKPVGFPNYSSGSWGPQQSDLLLKRDGRYWQNIEEE